jgi:hypothetical protein
MAIVFVLKHYGLAWSWFILISVTLNIIVAYGVDVMIKAVNPETDRQNP